MVHRIVFAYDIRLKIISHIFIGDIDSCQKEFDRHAFFHAFIEWLEVIIRFLPIQILGIFHQIIIAKVVVTVKIGNHTLNLRKRIFRCIIDFHRRWHIQHIRLTIYPIAIHAKRYRLRIVIWMGIESVEEIIIQSRYFLRPFSFNLWEIERSDACCCLTVEVFCHFFISRQHAIFIGIAHQHHDALSICSGHHKVGRGQKSGICLGFFEWFFPYNVIKIQHKNTIVTGHHKVAVAVFCKFSSREHMAPSGDGMMKVVAQNTVGNLFSKFSHSLLRIIMCNLLHPFHDVNGSQGLSVFCVSSCNCEFHSIYIYLLFNNLCLFPHTGTRIFYGYPTFSAYCHIPDKSIIKRWIKVLSNVR